MLTITQNKANAAAHNMSHHTVNGLDVYLINTHSGNDLALTVNVQAGSLHDEPTKYAGLAHYWEHVIHGGSKKFPGHKRFFEEMNATGANYNAYTSDDRIYYHAHFHHSSLPLVAERLGAMISQPEWNVQTAADELATVMQEAADYQKRDSRVLFDLSMIQLLPKGHPLRMYTVGTAEQLANLKISDVKSVYYSNYKEGSMQVICAGNMDSMNEQDILKQIGEHFFPSNPTPEDLKTIDIYEAGKNKIFPSMVEENQSVLPYIEIEGSEGNKYLALWLSFKEYVDPVVAETLTDLVNLKAEGSLQQKLSGLGWVNSMSVSDNRLNNLSGARATFVLTNEGEQHREEIVEWFFKYLGDIATNGISDELLDYLKQRNISSYQIALQGSKRSAEFLATYLSNSEEGALDAFEIQKRYSNLSSADLAAAASLFNPERMLMSYMSPNIEGNELDETFSRKFSRVGTKDHIIRFNSAKRAGGKLGLLNKITFKKVDLGISESPLDGAKQEPWVKKENSFEVVFSEDHTNILGGTLIGIKTKVLTLDSDLKLRLFSSAFNKRFEQEIEYMSTIGVNVSLHGSGDGLLLTSSGNAAGSITAIEWIIEQFKSFEPTDTEIDRARERALQGYSSEFSNFSGSTAVSYASVFLTPHSLSTGELKEAMLADTSTAKEVMGSVSDTLANADIKLSMHGDYQPSHASSVRTYVRRLSPTPLSKAQRKIRNTVPDGIKKDHNIWLKLGEPKTDLDIGLSKSFMGPGSDSREEAAFSILLDELGTHVFSLNRVEKKLGYVHNAHLFGNQRRTFAIFYGGTEGSTREETLIKGKQIAEGWQTLIQKIKEGSLSEDGFESTKKGILSARKIEPSEAQDIASHLYRNILIKKTPQTFDQMTGFLEEVSTEEIYAVGRKYLIDAPSINVIASSKSPEKSICESYFSDPDSLRQQMSYGPAVD